MTKRDAYLKALRGEPADRLVWAPNLDYWLQVNRAEGTLPARYVGLSRDDIVRALGGAIWNRASGLRAILDSSIREVVLREGDALIRELRTPAGTLREVHLPTEGEHRSRFLAEHMIKTREDLATMRYVVEGTHYEPDYAPTRQALAATGDDGIVVNAAFCVPFIQFAKNDAGYQAAYFLWMDYRDEVDALIRAYHRAFVQGYTVLADGPADVIATGDNMDELTLPPRLFCEYAVPFYREVHAITSRAGKLFEGHWCGRTPRLLPLVPGCGLDVVEAVVTQPMAAITLPDALDTLGGRVAFQGGIPSILVCEVGGTRADFERYIEQTVLPQRGRAGFVLGMSDNTPPDADFSRMEAVARLIA